MPHFQAAATTISFHIKSSPAIHIDGGHTKHIAGCCFFFCFSFFRISLVEPVFDRGLRAPCCGTSQFIHIDYDQAFFYVKCSGVHIFTFMFHIRVYYMCVSEFLTINWANASLWQCHSALLHTHTFHSRLHPTFKLRKILAPKSISDIYIKSMKMVKVHSNNAIAYLVLFYFFWQRQHSIGVARSLLIQLISCVFRV